VAVEIGEALRVIGDHRVEIESLRVAKVGVGDGGGNSGPIAGEPAAEAVGVVAGAEVVVAGFGVAFFAFELIVLRASVGVGAFASVRIKIGVVANDAGVGCNDAGGAEEVFDVIDWVATSGEHGDTLSPKENVFGSGVSGGVRFGEDVASGAVPVELIRNGRSSGVGFRDVAATAII